MPNGDNDSSSSSNHQSVLSPFHNQNYHPPQFSYTNTTTLFPFSTSGYTEHYYVPSVNGNERLAFVRCPAQLVGPSERVENHNDLFLEQFRYAGVQQVRIAHFVDVLPIPDWFPS